MNISDTAKEYGRIIDRIGLVSIGVFCLCYSLFWSNFAELHINLPFLNFPIFIGETLLFFCVVLLVFKWKLTCFKFNYRYCLLLVYSIWMLIKAFWGYYEFGPLSFRNAALFYYPFFAVVSYHFYQKEYFNQKVLVPLLLIFAIAQITSELSICVFLPAFMLFLIVTLKIKKRWVRYLAYAALFYLFPLKIFFQLNRSMIIANIIVFLFLISSFLFGIAKLRKWYKALILFLMLAFLFLGFLRVVSTEQRKSLTNPTSLIRQFRQYDKIIKRKQKHFKPGEITAQLYNPNVNTAPTLFNNESSVVSLEELKEIHRKSRVIDMEGALEESITNNLKNKPEYIKAEAESLNKTKPETNVDTKTETKSEANVKTKSENKPNIDNLPSYQSKKGPGSFSQEGSRLIGNISVELVALLKEYKEKLLKEFEISIQNGIDKTIYDKRVEEITRNGRELSQKKCDIAKNKLSSSTKIPKEQMDYWNKKLNSVIQDAQTSIEDQRVIALDRTLDLRMNSMVSLRSLDTEYGNIIFRLSIWRDMLDDLMREKPWFGFSFGKPLRSISLEILRQGTADWSRDGWISAHNSFFHIIYRAGILGILMVISIFLSILYLTIKFIKLKSPVGLLLAGILLYWVVVANFAVVLELPQQAIPFWSLWGMTFAYLTSLKRISE